MFLYPAQLCPPLFLPHLPFLLTGAAVEAGLADDVAIALGRTTVAIVDDATGVRFGATAADEEAATREVWLTATSLEADMEGAADGDTLD
jgi:hypothetical protein